MPSCHSTNDIASELSHKNLMKEGGIVITNHQVTGRGQRGNQWIAEASKNLTFSLLLKPTFLNIEHNFFLNIIVSLAIHDFLSQYHGTGLKIKWPNDILYHDQKICGILIENFLKMHQIGSSIVGVGLNVNQENFPLFTATSLKVVTGESYELNKLLNQLMEFLESRYLQLKDLQLDTLKQEYISRLYWYKEKHTFFDQEQFEGIITDIDQNGRLMIRKNEQIVFYQFKEVKFIK